MEKIDKSINKSLSQSQGRGSFDAKRNGLHSNLHLRLLPFLFQNARVKTLLCFKLNSPFAGTRPILLRPIRCGSSRRGTQPCHRSLLVPRMSYPGEAHSIWLLLSTSSRFPPCVVDLVSENLLRCSSPSSPVPPYLSRLSNSGCDQMTCLWCSSPPLSRLHSSVDCNDNGCGRMTSGFYMPASTEIYLRALI